MNKKTEPKKAKMTTKKPAVPVDFIYPRTAALHTPVDTALLPVPKTVDAHPHRSVYDWFLKDGLLIAHENSSLVDSFEYAMMNLGKVKSGIIIHSKEHAAAMAGATLWRAYNPSSSKGGRGRGQGRKAIDGETGLARMSINLRPDQRQPFKDMGGSAWLRSVIDVHKKAAAGPAASP